MAKISTYPLDTNLIGSDYWIGSDANSNYATKNFTIDSVAEYMNRVATQQQALRYVYNNTLPNIQGSLMFDPAGANSVPFNGITTFLLNKNELTDSVNDISGYYNQPLGGSDVLITQCDNVSQWAVYRWNNSVQDATYTDFYNIDVTYKSGNGGLTASKDYFISLLTYAGQNDANFVFTLDGSANQYVINHNLNKYPSVTIVDGNDIEVYATVVFNSLNQVTLTFSSNFTGKAFFN